MKSLFLLFAVSSAVAQANAVSCKPDVQSSWQSASVSRLQGGAQNFLYQVSAVGTYLVADLLCSGDECVGFVNGVKASGNIEDTGDRVVTLSINDVYHQTGKPTKFVCEQ